jgi:predicted phage tail protein
LSSNGEAVENRVVLSDYTRATDFEKTVNFGNLSEGQYTVRIRAFSPYSKRGDTLEWGFGVDAGGKIDAVVTNVEEVKK